jgi:hypothetical protein
MGRENIFFYLRVLFLPIIIPLAILRAWTRSWASLERTHQEQEAQYARLVGVLPQRLRRQMEEGSADRINEEAVRRFAVLLGDYVAMRSRLPGAQEASLKSQYLNILDACGRRLRVAESRQQEAVAAVGPRRDPPRGRPSRRRRSPIARVILPPEEDSDG